MKCVRTHVMHARADVLATKFGIILLFSFFLLLLSSQASYRSPFGPLMDLASGNYAIVEASTNDSFDVRKFNTAGTFRLSSG